MQYVEGTNQELLTASPQFPALVIAHQGFDKARLHWHEGFEVVYVRRCRATVVKGTRRSMHHSGDVVLVPPRCLHSIELIQDPQQPSAIPQALSVTISPTELLPSYPYISQIQQQLDYEHIGEDNHKRLMEYCEQIFVALASGKQTRFLEANSWFYSMLTSIFNYAKPLNASTQENIEDETILQDGRVIKRIRHYVQRHYRESLSTAQVSQKFGYSREHFSRIFRRYSGVTFKDYVTRVRLLVACDLLTNTDMPINQIVRESGFPSSQTMRGAFDREFACTPSEYRARSIEK
ncbi:helix-turn-helix domain-containing protein [Bifidobacterium sp. 82T24]|uniref:Helix-turn-helix domain-containing protein n=1 Tax=Bifidobacterium saimiriisciurei TaxID=2661627 RepID=A0ABX0CDS4_9BIFI|nr:MULTISPECIES: AraC family transcriptional regulator [Bifidobacterium]MBW3088334.1 helix-turn-helix domain-containing protein [Bifidobacterium pluvialisilvae]NEG97037.1 helix-turn-helix domain-containing protein [Bifidobacterium sp. SMB2]NEH11980.1 helix-turn-helix domain-containing protein [Bifidobacterium saimiriisciurei]